MFTVADRVQETTNSPGTGTATLLGAVSGYQSFSTGIGANNTTFYVIADQLGTNWEVGLGALNATGTVLTRTTVYSSSNGGSTVNFATGIQYVWCDLPSSKSVIQGTAVNFSSIGATTVGTGAFTTLSASSTVSGAGFSNYFAAPPTIGSTTPNAGTFTVLVATSITDSGLTAGRVNYNGVGGLLTDSANMVFDGSTLTTLNTAYTGTLTGGTGVVNLGSGQFYKDASGNVGIGVVPVASAKLDILAGTNARCLFRTGANTGGTFSGFGITAVNSDTSAVVDMNYRAINHAFISNSTEAMRIDSSGNLLVGTTGTIVNNYQSRYGVTATTFNSNQGFIGIGATTTSSVDMMQFINPNGKVGSIATSGTATSYTTSSDYRLKTNVAPMTGALATVSFFKPVTYKWKADGSNGQGFIAHELAEVVPECVTGEKDAVDAEGKPVYQGIDTSFLVATLTAAIQELNAKVDAQSAEIKALKGVA